MPKARQLRVREFRSRRYFEGYQILQEKRWWGWKTIERIEVPSHVFISVGALGDTGGWVSPFTRYGRFGRDGLITPHA
jgi:hypothetical protein